MSLLPYAAFRPAAALITWGAGLTLAGASLFEIGRQAVLIAAAHGWTSGDWNGGMAVGGLAVVVGAPLLVAGAHQLATNIDLTARASIEVLGRFEARASASEEVATHLTRLAARRDAGEVTPEDFAAEKARLLRAWSGG